MLDHPELKGWSDEGKRALLLWLADARDEWRSRYGEASLQRYAPGLVPLWVDEALQTFTEDELIQWALSAADPEDPTDQATGSEEPTRPEDEG